MGTARQISNCWEPPFARPNADSSGGQGPNSHGSRWVVLRWARSVLPHEIVRWMGKDHSCKGVPPEMQSSALQSAYCDLTVAFGRLGYRLFSGGLGSRLAAEHDPAPALVGPVRCDLDGLRLTSIEDSLTASPSLELHLRQVCPPITACLSQPGSPFPPGDCGAEHIRRIRAQIDGLPGERDLWKSSKRGGTAPA